MSEHDIYKALEIWVLQNLLNVSILVGILAAGLAMVQGGLDRNVANCLRCYHGAGNGVTFPNPRRRASDRSERSMAPLAGISGSAPNRRGRGGSARCARSQRKRSRGVPS